MKWIYNKDKGKSFSKHLISLFGYRFYLTGRYTGNYWDDGMKEYDLAVLYITPKGDTKYIIRPSKG